MTKPIEFDRLKNIVFKCGYNGRNEMKPKIKQTSTKNNNKQLHNLTSDIDIVFGDERIAHSNSRLNSLLLQGLLN